MSRYLSCERVPKGPIIAQTAKILNVSCDYLLGVQKSESKVNEAVDEAADKENYEVVDRYVKANIVEALLEISKSLAIIAEAFTDEEEDFIEDEHVL